MITSDVRHVAAVLASTHRNHPETLQSLVPMFGGLIVITNRQLLLRLLDTETDWPWQEPPQQRPPNGLVSPKH
jgi:hypothetical protein